MRRLAFIGSLVWLATGCGSTDAVLQTPDLEHRAAQQEDALTGRTPFTPYSIVYDMYGGGVRSIVLVFSDTVTSCDDMRKHRNRPGTQRMALRLINSAYNLTMTTHYPMYARKSGVSRWGLPTAEGQLDVLDADCNFTQQEFVGGNLQLESIDSGSATAVISYNLVLEDQTIWDGRWIVKHCGGINNTGSLTRDDWTCR